MSKSALVLVYIIQTELKVKIKTVVVEFRV